MGSRKTVPPRAFRIVPFGDSHTICKRVSGQSIAVKQVLRYLVPTKRLLTLLQLEFFNTSLIRCNGSALDTDGVLLNSLGSINSDLVVGLIAVFETQIVVLQIDIKVRIDKLVLDSLPDNAGHLIAVEFHDRILNLDLPCGSHVAC